MIRPRKKPVGVFGSASSSANKQPIKISELEPTNVLLINDQCQPSACNSIKKSRKRKNESTKKIQTFLPNQMLLNPSSKKTKKTKIDVTSMF